jgi:hypothetical protein
MKQSDQGSVMKHASDAAKRADSWSRAKREYASKVTHSGAVSQTPNRQHQSQTTPSSSGQKK